MTITRSEASVRRAREVVAALPAAPDPAHAAERVLGTLLRLVPGAEAGALLLMHPQSGLFWTGAVTGLPPESCHPFFDVELATGEDSFRRMSLRGAPARALLLRGTDPQMRQRVVEPFGFVDELRAVLPDAGVCWGGVSLWRSTGAFTADDEALLDAVAADLGALLRRSVLGALDGDPSGPGSRGMLLVEDGRLVESALGDLALGQELASSPFDTYRHLDHLVALASTDPGFTSLVRTADGRWLSAYGVELSPGRVAVTLTAATPAELLGARVASAGLSPREVEVTRLLCRGLSDAEIAAELFLSPHTVHDHVKAIRRKLGVRSRAAVVSKVFSDAYFEAFVSTAAISHGG